jgi:hypothetical protein
MANILYTVPLAPIGSLRNWTPFLPLLVPIPLFPQLDQFSRLRVDAAAPPKHWQQFIGLKGTNIHNLHFVLSHKLLILIVYRWQETILSPISQH